MKGIILAGGSGTRLYPLTRGVSKQLLPVYDKPMIYYPLSVLMLAGIREILIISTPQDLPRVRAAARRRLAARAALRYAEQPRPEGLAQAFLIGAEFIGADTGLPDPGRQHLLRPRACRDPAARAVGLEPGRRSIFGYPVRDPERYGVVEFDADGPGPRRSRRSRPSPRSNYAVPGLYFYDNDVVRIAAAPEALAPAASWRSPTSTASTSSAASCGSSRWAAASPGSTPARTSRCWRPPTSCRRSRSGRA